MQRISDAPSIARFPNGVTGAWLARRWYYMPKSRRAYSVRQISPGDRRLLADQGVIDSSSWDQLRSFAAGGGGRGESCRDNGEGTWDCEIRFTADPTAPYYAILEPAENAYGWRISYVGLGGA